MEVYEISVPSDQNDFIMRVTLDGTPVVLHMAYNSAGDSWTLGYCDINGTPIVEGIAVIPNFPLNFWYSSYDIPQGLLYVSAALSHIGRYAFRDGDAKLIYAPMNQFQEGGV